MREWETLNATVGAVLKLGDPGLFSYVSLFFFFFCLNQPEWSFPLTTKRTLKNIATFFLILSLKYSRHISPFKSIFSITPNTTQVNTYLQSHWILLSQNSVTVSAAVLSVSFSTFFRTEQVSQMRGLVCINTEEMLKWDHILQIHFPAHISTPVTYQKCSTIAVFISVNERQKEHLHSFYQNGKPLSPHLTTRDARRSE